MEMLKLIKNDPWLKPFQDAIVGRYKYYLKRKTEIELKQGSLSDFATGYPGCKVMRLETINSASYQWRGVTKPFGPSRPLPKKAFRLLCGVLFTGISKEISVRLLKTSATSAAVTFFANS